MGLKKIWISKFFLYFCSKFYILNDFMASFCEVSGSKIFDIRFTFFPQNEHLQTRVEKLNLHAVFSLHIGLNNNTFLKNQGTQWEGDRLPRLSLGCASAAIVVHACLELCCVFCGRIALRSLGTGPPRQ